MMLWVREDWKVIIREFVKSLRGSDAIHNTDGEKPR